MFLITFFATYVLNKALSKQEGPNICWDTHFLIIFLNFNQLPTAKKGLKKQASLQILGPSNFVRVFR